ncbi:helix-turn-helix domain-containing protein [Enterococcus casseliflavus]|uniref:helix-turn-helix domain-containing protein n=1 Tax=Enterococcus casseliflavus TaxID=37734 RepID=UPI003BF4A13F
MYNLLLRCNLFDCINIIIWGDFVYPRIRDLREDKYLNQEQLAELLNISQITYSYYESGKLDIPTQL